MNIVLDTNTVISAMFWKGAPRQVLDLARSGKYTLFTSSDLLAELANVLGRKKFSEQLKRANTTVDDLVLGYAALANPLRSKRIPKTITADPDDDKVLACAFTANADLIVSGDSHLLDLREFEGIRIVTVNQLLEQY